MLSEPAMALERVRVCKRDGVLLAEPLRPPAADAAGLAYWQKLVVYASEQTPPRGRAAAQRARAPPAPEGAAGATALRGAVGLPRRAPAARRTFWSLHRTCRC